MRSKVKQTLLHMEEERVNRIAFIFATLAAVEAFVVVVVILGGPLRDSIILVMPFFGILLQVLERRNAWFKRYAKYAYMTLPFWCSVILIIDGGGRFAAVTQLYFMWLSLSIAYYDVKMVLFCSAMTISSTAGAIILAPDAMFKLDNLTIWLYILTVYIMATALAIVISWRMHRFIEQQQKVRVYEDKLIYLEQLEQKEEQHSEFIHNINHYFSAIGELARAENCDRIVGLLEELNGQLSQSERILYTRHKVLNAILSEKAGEAAERQIPFEAYVEPGLSLGSVTDGDLVSMLGNLLDNALEAAEQCVGEKRKVSLWIYMEKEGKVCAIKLVNSFAKPPVLQNNRFLSTKINREMHGIGIKSVENTAEKYGGYLQCIPEKELFTAILILPVKK